MGILNSKYDYENDDQYLNTLSSQSESNHVTKLFEWRSYRQSMDSNVSNDTYPSFGFRLNENLPKKVPSYKSTTKLQCNYALLLQKHLMNEDRQIDKGFRDINYGVLYIDNSSSIHSQIKHKKCDKSRHLHFVFSIDRSSSMEDNLIIVKTSLHKFFLHLIHLQNVKKRETMNKKRGIPFNIYVSVVYFNHELKHCVKCIQLTSETCDFIMKRIHDIKANGATNFGRLFSYLNDLVMDTYENIHIFFTDGFPNRGIKKKNDLMRMVSPLYSHFYIGIGTNHNKQLLYQISTVYHNKYYFIEDLTNIQDIYSDILAHVIESPIVYNLNLFSDTCSFYDENQNTWKNLMLTESKSILDRQVVIFKFPQKEESIKINIIYVEQNRKKSKIVENECIEETIVVDNNPRHILVRHDNDNIYPLYNPCVIFHIFRYMVVDISRKVMEKQSKNAFIYIFRIICIYESIHTYIVKNNIKSNEEICELLEDLKVLYKSIYCKQYTASFFLPSETSRCSQTAFSIQTTPSVGVDLLEEYKYCPVSRSISSRNINTIFRSKSIQSILSDLSSKHSSFTSSSYPIIV